MKKDKAVKTGVWFLPLLAGRLEPEEQCDLIICAGETDKEDIADLTIIDKEIQGRFCRESGNGN